MMNDSISRIYDEMIDIPKFKCNIVAAIDNNNFCLIHALNQCYFSRIKLLINLVLDIFSKIHSIYMLNYIFTW